MNGSLADPGLSALILWLVLPVSVAVAGTCFLMWWPRRDWVVLHGVVQPAPTPDAPTAIALPAPGGGARIIHLHLAGAGRAPKAGVVVALSHPPGQPEAIQQGTPTPLLAVACGGALFALLCMAAALGF